MNCVHVKELLSLAKRKNAAANAVSDAPAAVTSVTEKISDSDTSESDDEVGVIISH